MLIELSNATVVKNGVTILDRLTLAIGVGEHTAIVGPNGAGKSTLINLLTHDDRACADGRAAAPVRVLGSDRWHVSELRRRLGIVTADLHQRFVNGNSAGRVIARDAVVSGFFAAHGFVRDEETTPEMRAQAADALSRMGVAHLQDAQLDQMSTGEARRVLIARALVTSPNALVLDEPTTGLDLVARHNFLETIRRVARQGTTIVLVTHRVEEIIPEIRSVVLLKNGKIAASGPKATVLTAAHLSEVFGAPIFLDQRDGYFHARLNAVLSNF
jgi:iron complex transport system ATP-binding protein